MMGISRKIRNTYSTHLEWQRMVVKTGGKEKEDHERIGNQNK